VEPQRLTVKAACLRESQWVYWALPLAVGSGAALLFQDLQSPLAPRLALGLLCGAVVGFSLGLTGGGGSIFAVPLLVYGLDVAPREAVGISLAAVGATALLGAIQRLRAREVEIGIGLLFAAGGVLGAPVGSWLGRQLSADVLLLLFAGLMAFVAARMWSRAIRRPEETRVVRASLEKSPQPRAPACRHDPSGQIKLTAPCMGVMTVVGVSTGLLSGLFGVGGGFAIVPALVFFSTIDIHRAVATSLLAIALISFSGVAAHLAAGQIFAFDLTGLFIAGGAVGMGLGMLLSRRISGPRLQKLFATAIALVAVSIVVQKLV